MDAGIPTREGCRDRFGRALTSTATTFSISCAPDNDGKERTRYRCVEGHLEAKADAVVEQGTSIENPQTADDRYSA
jgi:hypothetical protein